MQCNYSSILGVCAFSVHELNQPSPHTLRERSPAWQHRARHGQQTFTIHLSLNTTTLRPCVEEPNKSTLDCYTSEVELNAVIVNVKAIKIVLLDVKETRKKQGRPEIPVVEQKTKFHLNT